MNYEKLQLDRQYLLRISGQLERFTKATATSYNCRCPKCGDSKKSKSKRRLYFIEGDSGIYGLCHNEGCYWAGVGNFMEDYFPDLYLEYKRELIAILYEKPKQDTFSLDSSSKLAVRTFTEFDTVKHESHDGVSVFDLVDYMYPVSELPTSSPEFAYLNSRGFTETETQYLFVADDFKQLSQVVRPDGDFHKLKENDRRLIIPFINFESAEMFAIQGRSFDPKEVMRYVTIKAADEVDKCFIKEPLVSSLPVICVEGGLDSLFIPNSIAANDSNLTRLEADIYVWDNEPDNISTIKKMEAAIAAGKKICVWDFSPRTSVDIGDLILKYRFTKEEIYEKILSCSCSGLMASYKLSQWRRV